MVKSGAIPGVVHDPPAGIRLLPSAPAYQQQREQQHLQASLSRAASSTYNAERAGRDAAAAAAAAAAVAGLQNAEGKIVGVASGEGAAIENRGSLPDAAGGAAAAAAAAAGSPGWSEQEPQAAERANYRGAGDGLEGERVYDDDGGRQGGAVGGYGEAAGGGGGGGGSGSGCTGAAVDVHSRPRTPVAVDWKELNRKLNFLLKEEGALTAGDLNVRFTQTFRKVCVFVYWLAQIQQCRSTDIE